MTRPLTRRRAIGGMAAAGLTSQVGNLAAIQEQSPRKPIRLGMIGTTHAHATKLSVYRESSDYEVVGLVEPDPDRQKQLDSVDAFRGLPVLTEDGLLSTPGLQSVLIETEIRQLIPTARRCIQAGMHVHIDKPAGESLSELRQVLDAAEAKGLMVQMGYMYRYNPGIQLLNEFLREGWLGEIFEVHAVMSKVVPASVRRSLAEYPGGIMFELGCHLIDLVVGISGRPSTVQSISRNVSEADDSLRDNMLAVLSYPKTIATVKSAAVEVEGFARRHLVVCGTQGTFHMQPLDNPAVRVAFDRPRGIYRKGYQDVQLPRYRRYVADAEDMAKVIREEKLNDFSYKHDLDVQATILQACGMPLR